MLGRFTNRIPRIFTQKGWRGESIVFLLNIFEIMKYFQEYVDVPVSVKLTHQPPAKRFVHSKATVEVFNQPDIVQIGHILAVKSDKEEGLILVMCCTVSGNQFEGFVLQKYSDDSINALFKLLGMPSFSITNNS